MKATCMRIAEALMTVATGLLLASGVQAEARRSGLANSLLIEDRDDIYFFPQRLTEHPNLISLTYGGAAAAGSGLLTLGGDSMVFAVAIHRGDVQAPQAVSDLANVVVANVAGPANQFGATFNIAPATIVDLLLGMRMGGGELGLRLALGHGENSTTASDMDTGQSDTFITGEVGYGWGERGNGARVDLSGALLVDFASQEAADTDTASGTFFGFSGLLRGFFPMDGPLELGLLGNLSATHKSVSNDILMGNPAATVLAFNLGGGIGPALHFNRVSLAAYAILNANIANQDPDSETPADDTSVHTLIFPGVHMAIEIPLTDWLFVRSGAQYTFTINGTSAPADNGTTTHGGAFSWNAGFGVVIDQFRFDGSLQQGFVTGGPNFIGGGNPGFLALASLSYSFDHLRHNASTVPPPAFAPPPPTFQPPNSAAPAEPSPGEGAPPEFP